MEQKPQDASNKEFEDFSKPKGKKKHVKEIIDGSLLTREIVVKQLPFILFLTFLAIIYIANRYHSEKLFRETSKLQREVADLRAESIATSSALMYISKQSEVAKMVKERGLDLVESRVPPRKIKK